MLTKTETENISLENNNLLNNQNYIISEKVKIEIIKADIINKKLDFINKIIDKIKNRISKKTDPTILLITIHITLAISISIDYPYILITLVPYFIILLSILLVLFYKIGNVITKDFFKFYYKIAFPISLVFFLMTSVNMIIYKDNSYKPLLLVSIFLLWPAIFYLPFLFIDFVIKSVGNIFEIKDYNIYIKTPFYKNNDSNSFLDIKKENYFIIKKS